MDYINTKRESVLAQGVRKKDLKSLQPNKSQPKWNIQISWCQQTKAFDHHIWKFKPILPL